MRKPGLHDLVGVQVAMSRMHAWTPERSLAVVDDLYQMGIITYPRTQSTGVDVHALRQAQDTIVLLRSAGHDIHPDSDARVLLTVQPEHPGVTFYEIPGIMPIAELPPRGGQPHGEDRRRAYDEIVAQFVHAIAPAT